MPWVDIISEKRWEACCLSANCQPFTPGVVWKRDRLLVFDKDCVTVMRLWPRPAAWRKSASQPQWRPCRPEIDLNLREPERKSRAAEARCLRESSDLYAGQLYFPGFSLPYAVRAALRAARELEAWRTAMRDIPPAVRAAVRAFPERQFALLSFCARCPGALDLLDATPALAFMLANSWVFGPRVSWPLRSVRALLRKRQRDQLRWLRFPVATEQTVRILRKVPARVCTVELLLYLRDAMSRPECLHALSHVPRVNRGVVRIVSDPRLMPHATPRLLAEAASSKREDREARLAKRMLRYLRMAKRLRRDASRVRFHSAAQLSARLEELAQEYEWMRQFGCTDAQFPEPPLPPTCEFQPIRTLRELADEGRAQAHCIATYTEDILAGRAYAYRVMLPEERATLLVGALGDRYDRRWRVIDCRRASNAAVSVSAHELIKNWLLTVDCSVVDAFFSSADPGDDFLDEALDNAEAFEEADIPF